MGVLDDYAYNKQTGIKPQEIDWSSGDSKMDWVDEEEEKKRGGSKSPIAVASDPWGSSIATHGSPLGDKLQPRTPAQTRYSVRDEYGNVIGYSSATHNDLTGGNATPALTKYNIFDNGEVPSDEDPTNPTNPTVPVETSPVGNNWGNTGQAPVQQLVNPTYGLAPTSANQWNTPEFTTLPGNPNKWNEPLTTIETKNLLGGYDATNPVDVQTRINALGGYTQANPLGYGQSPDTMTNAAAAEKARQAAMIMGLQELYRPPSQKVKDTKKKTFVQTKKPFYGYGGGGGGGAFARSSWKDALGNMNWNI